MDTLYLSVQISSKNSLGNVLLMRWFLDNQARVLVLVHGPRQIQNSLSKKDQSWYYNLKAPIPRILKAGGMIVVTLFQLLNRNPIPARLKKSFRHNLHNSNTIEILILWEGHIIIGY